MDALGRHRAERPRCGARSPGDARLSSDGEVARSVGRVLGFLCLATFSVGAPSVLVAQALTGRDSSALGRSLAAYIRDHPEMPLGLDDGHLVVDTASGTMTGFVGAAFRTLVHGRWMAPSDPAAPNEVHFAVGSVVQHGDTLAVGGAWSLCQSGDLHGNGRAVRYLAIRAGSGWAILKGEYWLGAYMVCNGSR